MWDRHATFIGSYITSRTQWRVIRRTVGPCIDRASVNSLLPQLQGPQQGRGPQVAGQQHEETVAQQDVTPTKSRS